MTPERRVVEKDPFNASTPLAALAEDVTPTSLHYVRNHFPVPRVAPEDADAWALTVDGRVRDAFTLTLADLKGLAPARDLTVTLECAGNGRSRMTPQPPGTPWDEGAVSTARFTGVPLRVVLERAGVLDDAEHVLFVGADEGDVHGTRIAFERALPVAKALHEDTLLAWAMNDAPLPADHGFPLRVVVPGWFGVASVKWITRVSVLAERFRGYYQVDRYTYEGEQPEGEPAEPVSAMRVKSLIATPADGASLSVGEETALTGRAWSGGDPVVRVDVSVDGGRTWQAATLDEPVGTSASTTREPDGRDASVTAYAWRGFRYAWTPLDAGETTLMARAVDAAGVTQPLDVPWNAHGYGNNAVLPVRVRVA